MGLGQSMGEEDTQEEKGDVEKVGTGQEVEVTSLYAMVSGFCEQSSGAQSKAPEALCALWLMKQNKTKQKL